MGFFTTDTFLWAIRIVMVGIGSALAQKGIIDNDTWTQITSGVLTIGGAVWSYFARKSALATDPAEV